MKRHRIEIDGVTFNRNLWLSRSKISNSCLLWEGAKHRQGYGMIGVNDNGVYKMFTVHRLAMMIHLGRKLTDQDYVLHTCENLNCINPNHLKLTTRRGYRNKMRKVGNQLNER